MKMMLAVCLLLCATAALTRAAALPEEQAETDQSAENDLVKRASFCSRSWTSYKSRCFRYIPRPMTWAKAERNCRTMGGTLASVHSIQEYHKIQSMIMTATHEFKEAWIGGSDAQEENLWLWSDGKPFHYTDWCDGEPNNHSRGQNCLLMNHAALKCWDNLQCNARRPSVCTKKTR